MSETHTNNTSSNGASTNGAPHAAPPVEPKRIPLRSLPAGHPRLCPKPVYTSVTVDDVKGLSWRLGMKKVWEADGGGNMAQFCERIDWDSKTWSVWMTGADGKRGAQPRRKMFKALLARLPVLEHCTQPLFDKVTHMKRRKAHDPRTVGTSPLAADPATTVAPEAPRPAPSAAPVPKSARVAYARDFQHWATKFASLPAPALSTFRHLIEAAKRSDATLDDVLHRVEESAARPVAT